MSAPGPLTSALGLDEPTALALVGSGGKTTLLGALGRELAAAGAPVVLGTTTKMYPPRADLEADLWLWQGGRPSPGEIERRLKAGRPLFLADRQVLGGKLAGIFREQARVLGELPGIWCLLEADGSAGRPLKAWADYEPVVPELCRLLVVLVGAAGLGKPLGPRWVHRPELFGAASGLAPGQRVTPAALARVLSGPGGPLKERPPASRVLLVVNQVDAAAPGDLRHLAAEVHGDFEDVLWGSLAAGRLARKPL